MITALVKQIIRGVIQDGRKDLFGEVGRHRRNEGLYQKDMIFVEIQCMWEVK